MEQERRGSAAVFGIPLAPRRSSHPGMNSEAAHRDQYSNPTVNVSPWVTPSIASRVHLSVDGAIGTVLAASGPLLGLVTPAMNSIAGVRERLRTQALNS